MINYKKNKKISLKIFLIFINLYFNFMSSFFEFYLHDHSTLEYPYHQRL